MAAEARSDKEAPMRNLHQAQTISRDALPILGECKRAIQDILPNAAVLLYGSLARGTAGPESDWDILVLANRPISAADEERVRAAVYALELKHDVVLSLLLYSSEEWDDPPHRAMPFHEEVEREGLVL
jgi:predicted nucleotidyltransferase